MLKVLFIKPKSWVIRKVAVPPLGIMYIAAYLRNYFKDDIAIKIIDNRLCEYNEEELYGCIRDFDPSLVCISSITVEAEDMHAAAKAAKRFNREIMVIAGGPHPTQYHDEVILDRNIDALVLGEGELTVLELVKSYISGKGYDGVKGILLLRDGQAIRTPARELIPNLDLLPFPAWDLIDMKAYSRIHSMSMAYPREYMVLFTSRGCPYKCIYCHGLFGRAVRVRSVANVTKELEILVNEYHISNFEIIDDIFNFDYKRAQEILDFIISRSYKIKFSFPNGLRSDLLDYNMLYKMKKAGVVFISFAIETASKRMQQVIDKKVKLDKAEEAIRIASELKILTNGFFMLGFPGETRQDMSLTIDFAVRSKLDTAYFFIVTPFKGTPIFENNKELIKNRFNNISYKNYSYFRGFFNLSDVQTNKLIEIQQRAYLKFYFSPKRVVKIVSRFLRLEKGVLLLIDISLMMLLLIFMRKLDKTKCAA